MTSLLEDCLESAPPRVQAIAIVEAAGRRLAKLPPILRRLVKSENEEILLAVTEALARLGGDTAEEDLLTLLHKEPTVVKEGAARALGTYGTIAAVPALRELAADHSASSELGHVARESIARIQARIRGIEGGELSLVPRTSRGRSVSRSPVITVR